MLYHPQKMVTAIVRSIVHTDMQRDMGIDLDNTFVQLRGVYRIQAPPYMQVCSMQIVAFSPTRLLAFCAGVRQDAISNWRFDGARLMDLYRRAETGHTSGKNLRT